MVFGFVFSPSFLNAADMYLILDKNQVAEQGIFSGTVYVSTGGLPINNAESTIHFPADLLSVDSVSTLGSIFNIWVEQPSFSNIAGTIYFNGGLPTPGYSGQSGNTLRINFRAKKQGVADLSFGSSAVRANDGSGTNVLSQTRGSSISIAPVAVIPPPLIQIGLPKAPVITSEDMPIQNDWYNKINGRFFWDLPTDVTAVQLILSSSSDTDPSITYDPPIKNKTLADLADGVVYLNARFKNANGWGKITSRKIQIDTTEPEGLSVNTRVTEDDLVSIEATAKDALSGIKSYVVYVGGKKIAEQMVDAMSDDIASATVSRAINNITTNDKTKFNLVPLKEGQTKLAVRVYDKAGNYSETDVSVNVPETKAPKITHYPEYINIGSKIEIRGKSPYVGADINVWIKEEGKEAKSYLVKSDEDKVFLFTSDSIETSGTVSVWAETVRSEDVRSEESEKVYISAKETNFVWLGSRIIQIVSIVITILVLLFGLLALIYLGIRKLNILKRNLRRDLIHTEQEVHRVFEILKGDTKRHLKMLERASTKRKLTKEESKIFAELSEDLDETEKYLAEKIENIEKQDLLK